MTCHIPSGPEVQQSLPSIRRAQNPGTAPFREMVEQGKQKSKKMLPTKPRCELKGGRGAWRPGSGRRNYRCNLQLGSR